MRLAAASGLLSLLCACGHTLVSGGPHTMPGTGPGGRQMTTVTDQAVGMPPAARTPVYPITARGPVADNYFGTKVADPYRWLEDDRSPEVAAWVEAQNKVTSAYLEQIPYRAAVKDRLLKLYNYPKYSAPTRRGDWFFSTKNDGLQNQSVWYIQKGLDGTPELLLDPNTFSKDGTSRLGSFSISHTGKYVGYGISQGGSDWNEIHVLDVATKKPLDDKLEWVKFSSASWRGDEGFYYNRYPTPPEGKKMAQKNEYQKTYYHKVGTPQSQDVLVYEDNNHPGQFNGVGVSDDLRFEFMTHTDNTTGKNGNSLFFRDVSKNQKEWTPIVAEIGNDDYGVVDNLGDKFLIRTNHGAPNGKIALYDPKTSTWSDVIPEKPEPLEGTNTVGGKLFVSYLKDVTTRAYVYS
ncbi:MAG: hypothetical protein JOY74_00435, partial [Sinobacteraceae bacterium]|nr:hypothetical protein [Nevskiaceae bacterium]